MLREFGSGNAPVGDRTMRRLHNEPQVEEGWIYSVLRSMVGFSKLANELMIYRALPPATTDDVASLYGVFSETFGYRIRWPAPVLRFRASTRLSASLVAHDNTTGGSYCILHLLDLHGRQMATPQNRGILRCKRHLAS